MTQSDKPRAFLLTGSFPVISRDPLYLAELTRRGLLVLVITSEAYRERALAQIGQRDGPMSAITDITFVAGDYTAESAFVAGAVAATTAWQQAYDIVGVYAVGDMLAEPTGLLCDGLGKPGPGLLASRACRCKYLQRFYVPELSPRCLVIPAARRAQARASSGGRFTPDAGLREAIESIGFPAVVKPASRASSWGVLAVLDFDELCGELDNYREHEIVLVEERIDGQEYSVESLIQHGMVVFASPTRKETTHSHERTFVELSHTVPEHEPGVTELLLQANAVLLERLKFADGIAHSEWRVTADGRAVLMEVAGRTPGDGIMALYHLAVGEPMELEILNIALGVDASYPAPRRYARQVYLEHEPGVLEDVTVAWPGAEVHWLGESGVWPEIKPGPVADEPTLRAVLVLKDRGARLGPLQSSDDRAVTFFIDAASPAELDKLEQRVRAAISISTRG
ncbi:MAG TPA: ATP-grasp domain-containing protein [Streptosporangiaceae bacterium]|nr:ATP-grasp domain-containing protein [Streptosporangiaceae bacterium]